MMKHLRLFLTMLILTLLGGVNMAWAGESEVFKFAFTKQSGPSAYEKTYDVTIGSKSWTIPGNLTNGDYLRIGGKSITTVDRVIQCNDALSGNISRIEFNHNGKSRANIVVHSVTLTVASNDDFSTVVDNVVVSEPTVGKSTGGSFSFEPSTGVEWSGELYYRFTVKVSNPDSSNGGFDLTSLVFFENVTGAVDPSVSFANESETIEIGETVTNELTKPNDLTVTYSSNPTSVATVDEDGVVTGVAEGEATITASWEAVADKYNAGSVSYTLTVNAASPTVNYVKVTDINQLVAGNEYIIVGTKGTKTAAMGKRTGTNTYRDMVEITVNDDVVAVKESDGVAILTLGGSTGAWTFLASDNSEYLAYTSTSNALHSATDATLTTSQWIITDDFQLESAATNGRYIQYNSGSTRFACYTSGQGTSVLYVKEGSEVSTKVDPGFSFSATTATANVGETFTAPEFSNPNNVAVTFASTNEAAATVDSEGNVTIVGAGETVISATSEETDEYNAGSASYTLTVTGWPIVLEGNAFVKVTSTDELTDGYYLIVNENEDGNVAFNGSLETLDAASNTTSVSIVDKKLIAASDATKAAAFLVDVTGSTLQSASGKYIGVSSNSNGLKQTETASTYKNTFSIDEDGNAVITAAFDGSTMTLRFNSASNQDRFRYYSKSGQQAIQLYKLTTVAEVPVTIGATEYATLYYSDKALAVAEGVKATIVTNVDGGTVTTESLKGFVPKATGVVLNGVAGDYTFLEVPGSTTEAPETNMLQGSDEAAQTTGGGKYYMLSLNKSSAEGSVGFYYAKDCPNGEAFENGAHKAYLVVPESTAGAKSFYLFSEASVVDAINALESSVSDVQSLDIYNLKGQKVQGSMLKRGIYVVNGRKVVVK